MNSDTERSYTYSSEKPYVIFKILSHKNTIKYYILMGLITRDCSISNI